MTHNAIYFAGNLIGATTRQYARMITPQFYQTLFLDKAAGCARKIGVSGDETSVGLIGILSKHSYVEFWHIGKAVMPLMLYILVFVMNVHQCNLKEFTISCLDYNAGGNKWVTTDWDGEKGCDIYIYKQPLDSTGVLEIHSRVQLSRMRSATLKARRGTLGEVSM